MVDEGRSMGSRLLACALLGVGAAWAAGRPEAVLLLVDEHKHACSQQPTPPAVAPCLAPRVCSWRRSWKRHRSSG